MKNTEKGSLSMSERGTVAVIAAVCLVAMLAVATLALDGAFIIRNKQNIQDALDMAALSGAKLVYDESIQDSDLKGKIESSFVGNMATSKLSLTCDHTVATFDRDIGTVSATVNCYFKPMLGGTIAPSSVKIAVTSKTLMPLVKIDVAMALDVSRSMRGAKLQDLQDAAKAAAATLINSGKTDHIRVSFAAYANSVNVGEYGPYVRGETTTLPASPDSFRPTNCMTERLGDGAEDDSAPGPGAYFPARVSRCFNTGVFPLSSDLSAFETAVDRLSARGSTAGHLGIAWAWYFLSPKWASVWPSESEPLAYNAPGTAKVMILMTDGRFNEFTHSGGAITSSDLALKLCENMRAADILIYTIAFQAPPEGQDTLLKCAGQADRYFEVSSRGELIAAYQDIAGSVIHLRITE